MPLYNRQASFSIEDGFDRRCLAAIKQRFLALNYARMSRAREALQARQRVFLDTLPLLFHSNHPMMPGFVSQTSPCGISGYRPDKADLLYSKAVVKNYRATEMARNPDILALFVMGSVGTIAQNSHSDLDIWLCHRPDLGQSACAELTEKCSRITQWAKALNLEVHFFLMNHEDFHQGKQADLDDEASGTAQRFLLLDEFYRTALYVAGRMPAWWFVPPDKGLDYAEHINRLVDQRFLQPDSIIDFGNASDIPLEEYFGAGIWQLYKAITSPHKAVLKLLTIESYLYAKDKTTLSDRYKQAIYQGEDGADQLDPYLMAYDHIEHYLKCNQEFDRLEIARRCLYLKIDRQLHEKEPEKDSWQCQLLRKNVERWRWPSTQIASLDQHKYWSVLQVKEERNQLVHMLNQSYHALADCANQRELVLHISKDELLILERKLHAAFERRPGKLDWLNLDMSLDISEPNLNIITSPASENMARYWQLYSPAIGFDQPLKQTQSLVELIFWCYSNKVADIQIESDAYGKTQTYKTQWNLKQAEGLASDQIQYLLHTFTQWAPNPRPSKSNAAFKQSAMPVSALLIINANIDKPETENKTQSTRLSDTSDAFNYSNLHENLVHCVDILVKNSWDEYVCHHVSGGRVLEQTLDVLFSLCLPGCHQTPPDIHVETLDSRHGTLVTTRFSEWLEKIYDCYYSGSYPRNTRFVYAQGSEYVSLQFKGPRHHLVHHTDRYELYHFLGEAQRDYSPVILDHFTQKHDLLSLATKKMSETGIQIFFQVIKDKMLCYVFDEKGSLCTCSLPASNNFRALYSMKVFLQSILKRIPNIRNDNFDVYPIDFFQAQMERGRLTLYHKTLSSDHPEHQTQSILAAVSRDGNGQLSYDFYTEDTVFLWSDYGDAIFQHVTQTLPSDHPVYPSDLDLENYKQQFAASNRLQTSHYLKIKLDIERKLNEATKGSDHA